MIKNRYLFFISILLLFTSCFPFLKMESGKTLGKGVSSIGANVTSYSIIEDNEQHTIPYIEIKYQYGILDKMDLSLGINGVGFITVDGKYQLVGDQSSKYALSVGLGADSFLFIPKNGDSFSPEPNLKISLPIYTSVHISDRLYYYLAPQYSKMFLFNGNNNNISFVGASTGLGFLWRSLELNLGGTYVKPIKESSGNVVQFGVGVKYLMK